MKSKSGGTNFHQHSHYSFLDGCSSPEQICKRVKELSYKYVCLSDHGNVAGHIDMYDQAKAHELIPILGTELYCKDNKYDNAKVKGYHLCIWALNEKGLHNVWAISSNTYYATGDGHRTPNAQWEHLEGHGEGVACTSACLAGAISQAALNDDEEMALYFANRYKEIFDEFYLEIHTNSMPQQRQVNLWLIEFAKKYGFKCVYAVDAHYALKKDAEFHDLWLGCQTKSFYDQKHWTMEHEYYIQSEAEVSERLSYLGDNLSLVFAGIDDFLSKVETYEIETFHKVPKFPLPDGWTDSGDYLKFLAARGLLEKVGGCKILPNKDGDPINTIHCDKKPRVDLTPYLKQLAEDELPIIVEHGLSDYFLIVADYCAFAKERMLVGCGRGSCVGSVLCYLLNITEVDPIGKGLFFSRFLNEGRLGSLPDIDIDFNDSKKPLVHEYLSEKYGHDKVTAVGVTTFFGVKLALKEVCRYYRIPVADANRITSLAEQLEDIAGDGIWSDYIYLLNKKDRDFLEAYVSAYPSLFDKANQMVGLARHSGKHAAGYVISPFSLADSLPIRKTSNDEIVSQFDKVAVERLGYLKADVLGLRTLTTLEIAANLVKERTGKEINFYELEENPDDTEVWELFAKGRTLGTFQTETKGITGVCRMLKPKSISDISIILALYRPGVLLAKNEHGENMLDEFIARATGERAVEYITPELEPILKDTYGICCFQEQSMRIFTDLAGFNAEQADHIRAAIGKKKLEKIQAEKPRYLEGCKRNGIDQDKAELIFSQIEASGSYQFNKSHSLGYATVTFWTAYMKAHYPLEFYAACMSTVSFEKAPLFIHEAKRRGISIVAPVLSDLSDGYRVISDSEISFGLNHVKQVGEKAIEKILAAAPYSGFEDFTMRSCANSRVVKQLIKGGVFREYYPNRKELLARFEDKRYKKNPFDETLNEIKEEEFSRDELAEIEAEIFGISISVDSFDGYREALGGLYETFSDLDLINAAMNGTLHHLLVRIDSVRLHTAKSGMMAFVTATTDGGEQLDITCFPRTFEVINGVLQTGVFLVVEVKKDEYNGRLSLVLNKALKIERKLND